MNKEVNCEEKTQKYLNKSCKLSTESGQKLGPTTHWTVLRVAVLFPDENQTARRC